MCRLPAPLLTLHVEIPCHHPNPYFLKDPKGCALVQGPSLDTGRVPDHHIPGQDQGRQAVDPLRDLATTMSQATADTVHTEILLCAQDHVQDRPTAVGPGMTATRNISTKG